jgi:hypothetical protein
MLKLPIRRDWLALGLVAIIALVGLGLAWSLRDTSPHDDRRRLLGVQFALDAYRDQNGHFPPAVISEHGRPPYSWRVAILPYLDRQDLFKSYRFDETWDSPGNKQLLRIPPSEYVRYNNTESGFTNVVVVIDEKSVFPPGRYTSESDIVDPQSQTILVVQVPETEISWTEPRDISYEQFVSQIRATQDKSSDDRVRFITPRGFAYEQFRGDEDQEVSRALMTINDHDDARPFFAK